ncbi:MAG TPA: hypothetical protein VMK65_09125 [Longimicrobiales bacterium]|nr:hypothetical protein [Longimicrobiales bacterium]
MSSSIRVPLALLLLLSAGCVTHTSTVEQAPTGEAVAATLVVERFLQAVNANDIQTMARLFGTRDGSITGRDPQAEVEQRMFTLASYLRYEDYSLAGERVVPGRIGEAIQIMTALRLTGRSTPARVPFTLVRSRDGGWLVEQIGVDDLARRR